MIDDEKTLIEDEHPDDAEPTGLEPTGLEPTGLEPTGLEPTGLESPRRGAAAQAAGRARRMGSSSRPTPGGRANPDPKPISDEDAGSHADTAVGATWWRWIPAGVAAALVVVLAVVDVLLWQRWHDQPTKAESRERLVASVNAAVSKILSYDYRHLDADESAASTYLTGTFKDQYVASMNTTIKKGAPPAEAVVVGKVGWTALTSVSGDGNQAVALVLGQQKVTNTVQKTPRYDMVSLRVTAQLVRGKWLVSDLATP